MHQRNRRLRGSLWTRQTVFATADGEGERSSRGNRHPDRFAGRHRNSLWKHTNPPGVGGCDDRTQRSSDCGTCTCCRPHGRDRQRPRIPSSSGPAGGELVGGLKRPGAGGSGSTLKAPAAVSVRNAHPSNRVRGRGSVRMVPVAHHAVAEQRRDAAEEHQVEPIARDLMAERPDQTPDRVLDRRWVCGLVVVEHHRDVDIALPAREDGDGIVGLGGSDVIPALHPAPPNTSRHRSGKRPCP